MSASRTCAVALIGACAVGSAGAASASFNVHITLATRASVGVCINQSLSDAVGALIKIECDTGQFVSIEAAPAKRFLGTIGGSSRVWFGADSLMFGSLQMPSPSAASASSFDTSPRQVQVQYVTRLTGQRVGLPQPSAVQTKSTAAYQNLYRIGLGSEAQTEPGLMRTQQEGPVEMLIVF